tara:strand:- start:1890 stop:3644 length:1755 start_codon:yes stop_codon:yes gene_type:complete
MTIIGQGESDLFVKSSPEERRIMIEEILGLKEFRLKKNEANRKLKTTKINMEKVAAMVDEIKPHLRFLRRQRRRWDKRTEIEQEGKELENKYFGFHIKKYKNALEKIQKTAAPIESKKKTQEQVIIKLEETLKAFEKQNYEKIENSEESDLEKFLKEKSEIEREIVRIETKLEIQKSVDLREEYSVEELIDYAKTLRKELKETAKINDIENIKDKVLGWLKKLEKIFNIKEKKEESKTPESTEKLREKLQNIENKIQKVRGEEKNLIENQQKINQEFKKQLEQIENEKNAIRALETQLQKNLFEKEKLQLKIEDLKTQWESLERTKEELERLAEKREETEEIDWKEAEKRIFKLRAELASIGEIDKELLGEAKETEERYEFLSKELEDLERASGDLKEIIKDLETRVHNEFKNSFKKINEAFNTYFGLMFGGGRAKLKLTKESQEINEDIPVQEENKENEKDSEDTRGVDFEINIPRKKIKNLDMLSGGEKSLVSMAALFSLISISPPPFLVLDEIDAALDDENARRFSELLSKFSDKTQFIIVTHNKITMEKASILYGITMGEDGVSKVLSLRLEDAEKVASA